MLVVAEATASAGPITNPADFATAVAALPGANASTLTFDSLAVGASPEGENGIHFQFIADAFGNPLDIVVTSTYNTNSEPNSLGVDDGGSGVFLALDQWRMTFDSPLFAIGMFFITNPDGLLEGDIQVQTSAGVASNSSTPFATLADDGLVYFVGFVSDSGAFNSATIGYGAAVDGINFEYNVDDITTVSAQVVPEPPTIVMTLTTLLLVAFRARRRSNLKNDVKE